MSFHEWYCANPHCTGGPVSRTLSDWNTRSGDAEREFFREELRRVVQEVYHASIDPSVPELVEHGYGSAAQMVRSKLCAYEENLYARSAQLSALRDRLAQAREILEDLDAEGKFIPESLLALLSEEPQG